MQDRVDLLANQEIDPDNVGIQETTYDARPRGNVRTVGAEPCRERTTVLG